MKKFQEGKKYVFVAKKVKRGCNNREWKMSRMWANEINGREVQYLVNEFEGIINEFTVTASWCKEVN